MKTSVYDEYIEQGFSRHQERQVLHLAGIKARYHDLNIDWNPTIEQEAMKRDGGGITVYLRRIAAEQEETRKQARVQHYQENCPEYGTW